MLRSAAVALSLLAQAGTEGGDVVDRTVAVFVAPETGGADSPRAITLRELAFEARVEALAAGESPVDDRGVLRARFVRAALDRHVATELLASVPVDLRERRAIDPCSRERRPAEDDRRDLELRVAISRGMLVTRVRGESRLAAAAAAEGLTEGDVLRMVRREALAARYVDLVIAPMAVPSPTEVREAHRATPGLRDRPLSEVSCDLARAILSARLGQALAQFRESSRSRVTLTLVPP